MDIIINIAIIIGSSVCYSHFELYKYLDMFILYNLIIIFTVNYLWNIIYLYFNPPNSFNMLDTIIKKIYDNDIYIKMNENKDNKLNSNLILKDKVIKELKDDIHILEEYISMTNGNRLYYTEFGKKFHKSAGCISANINIYNFIVVDNEMIIILERADRMCSNCDFDENNNNDKITLYYAKTGKKLYITLVSIEKTTAKDRIFEITIPKMQYNILLGKMPDLFIE
jgi:hypothetical protein